VTLAETCDRIEVALEHALVLPTEFIEKDLLRALVELGKAQIDRARLADSLGDASELYTEDLALDLAERWVALKARVAEALK
jgi:hypothetical protein